MKSILNKIKSLFSVEYRLTAVVMGKYEHVHGRDKRLVLARLNDISNVSHWTLYKRGPFFIKEHEIERGER